MSRSKVNVPLLVGGLLLTTVVVGFLGWGFAFDPKQVPTTVLDEPAPDFELTTLSGDTVRMADLAGKPVVLNFWSTWCVPCKQEHPVLVESASMYPEVTFLGVVYNDEAAKVKAYLERNGTAYPHLMDPTGEVGIAYGVTGVPETYFVRADGTIARKAAFAVNHEVMAETLEPLLRGAR